MYFQYLYYEAQVKRIDLVTVVLLLLNFFTLYLKDISCGTTTARYPATFGVENILFVIISQPDTYNALVAQELKTEIENQFHLLNMTRPKIYLTHEDYLNIPLSWTFVPLFKPLVKKYYHRTNVTWVVFLDPHTIVRSKILMKTLAAVNLDHKKKWIGYALKEMKNKTEDDDPPLLYPHLRSGFAMRLGLMAMYLEDPDTSDILPNYSVIYRAGLDLARLIIGVTEDVFIADRCFCSPPQEDNAEICATYPKPVDICGKTAHIDQFYFAVKTWSDFHSTRAQIVKNTWGKHTVNLKFFSNKADPTLPAVRTGVQNTKKGHCAKTMAILRMVVKIVKNMPQIKWIVLADDDTVLGVRRLAQLLTCYNSKEKFISIGERYGYIEKARRENPTEGIYTDFVPLGGGQVFNVAAAEILSKCRCPKKNSPDDVTLGFCIQEQNFTFIQTSMFHQDRPELYTKEELACDSPVTFHCKYDADKVYNDFFYDFYF